MGRVIRTRGFGSVLSDEDRTLVREAEATVDRARRRADAVLTEARREAEAIRAAAAGAGRAEAAAALLHADELTDAMRQRRERELLSLAATLAQRLIQEELQMEPSRIAQLAQPVLDRMGRAPEARLRAHPDDVAALCDTSVASVIPDPALERGDCVVESKTGSVDGRLEVQLDALVTALARKLPG